MDAGLRMHPERTPNPHSVKWVLGTEVLRGGAFASFDRVVGPDISPLATCLFEVSGVTGVLLGPDFVTVSKQEDRAWAELAPPIGDAIKLWAASGEPALGDTYTPESQPDGDEVISRIRAVLEEEIGPYVAQDGGEVAFVGFSEGVVQVHLRGACAGCPSSSVTLKLGIEARLREEVPEVHSVVAV